MNQTQVFIEGEADAWFERNKINLGQRDMVSAVLGMPDFHPKAVLEVGCANGWRLKKLKEKYGCEIAGVDPSVRAVKEADCPSVVLGTANRLRFLDGEFDLVIYGFCLYLTDPEDWFKIVAEGDRVLTDGGRIVIHEFSDNERPHAVPYEHAEGVLSYHVNFAGLWLMHPWYRLCDWRLCGRELVTVIEKNTNRIPVVK